MAKDTEQGFIEGMAPEKNKVVHKAALAYERARDDRMALSKVEKVKKDALTDAMISEGLTRYEWSDLLVELNTSNTPKVKRTSEDAAESDEE